VFLFATFFVNSHATTNTHHQHSSQPMVLYTAYIYNKSGECIFYRDWSSEGLASARSTSSFGKLSTLSGGSTPNTPSSSVTKSKKDLIRLEGDMKLMYGLIYSLKAFVKGIAPKENESFRSFNTSTYKLHFYESPTGFKFIFLSDPNAGDLDERLTDIYAKIFVPYVVSNPLYVPFEKIDCHLFTDNLDKYVQQYMQ
jgi:hypothetical protein